MRIEMIKLDDGNVKVVMTGRLDEHEIIVGALENVYNETNSIREVRAFMRKKLNEVKAR